MNIVQRRTALRLAWFGTVLICVVQLLIHRNYSHTSLEEVKASAIAGTIDYQHLVDLEQQAAQAIHENNSNTGDLSLPNGDKSIEPTTELLLKAIQAKNQTENLLAEQSDKHYSAYIVTRNNMFCLLAFLVALLVKLSLLDPTRLKTEAHVFNKNWAASLEAKEKELAIKEQQANSAARRLRALYESDVEERLKQRRIELRQEEAASQEAARVANEAKAALANAEAEQRRSIAEAEQESRRRLNAEREEIAKLKAEAEAKRSEAQELESLAQDEMRRNENLVSQLPELRLLVNRLDAHIGSPNSPAATEFRQAFPALATALTGLNA